MACSARSEYQSLCFRNSLEFRISAKKVGDNNVAKMVQTIRGGELVHTTISTLTRSRQRGEVKHPKEKKRARKSENVKLMIKKKQFKPCKARGHTYIHEKKNFFVFEIPSHYTIA